jgi:hypothetical protein
VLMAANLLVNGNFSHGATGFATAYHKGGTSLVVSDTYLVGANPHTYHFAGAAFGDHTTGSGKMLLINGSTTPAAIAWRETVNVAKGVEYAFTGFAASWATDGPAGGDISPADVLITINNTPVLTSTLPSTPGQWAPLTSTWLATGSRATITITDLNTSLSGNDSAYDDLSFSPLASIHGNVVSATVNTHGKVSQKHLPLAGVVVFLDTNNNDTFDPGESIALTNKTGAYTFTGLAPGTYHVCQLTPPPDALPTAQIALNITSGKQFAHINLWDIYTAAVPNPFT